MAKYGMIYAAGDSELRPGTRSASKLEFLRTRQLATKPTIEPQHVVEVGWIGIGNAEPPPEIGENPDVIQRKFIIGECFGIPCRTIGGQMHKVRRDNIGGYAQHISDDLRMTTPFFSEPRRLVA